MTKARRSLFWGKGWPTAAIGALAAALTVCAALIEALPSAQAAPVTTKSEGFQTAGTSAALLDPDSNSFLFEKNSDQPFAPASLAKLMVLEYVFNEIRQGHIKLDDEYIISENAWRKGGAPSHGSTMFADP